MRRVALHETEGDGDTGPFPNACSVGVHSQAHLVSVGDVEGSTVPHLVTSFVLGVVDQLENYGLADFSYVEAFVC